MSPPSPSLTPRPLRLGRPAKLTRASDPFWGFFLRWSAATPERLGSEPAADTDLTSKAEERPQG
jgi:hypothetical protein